jgi:hypothetical protein
MDQARLIAELHRHQDGIVAHLVETRRLLGQPSEAAGYALAQRRWELARLLRAYQLFKHFELFDPLIRRGQLPQVEAATRMKVRCIDAGNAYTAFVRQWGGTDVLANWTGYARAVADMSDRVRAHLTRERQDSVALAGHVARRAA